MARRRVPAGTGAAGLRVWWARRTARSRVTAIVGGTALVAFLVLALVGSGLIGFTVTGAVDVELRRVAETAAAQVTSGAQVTEGAPGSRTVRVTDTAGRPLDGGPALPLDAGELRRLAAGESVTVSGQDTDARHRYLAVVATAPDGSPRLVIASTDLVGYDTVIRRGAVGLLVAALVAAAAVALASWLAARLALRPVGRMRDAAASLPPGERLPVPAARDELRAMAEELNDLLARRDEAAARLERFTGDAAHELRSPVASIRVQAEVATAHPDPELAEQTLRSVAAEASRLSDLLSDLLALARADAGRRPAAEPVDLVALARAAVARAAGGPAVRLVAPLPAVVAAAPGEVGVVLDNLLANACRHAGSLVTVSVLPAGQWTRLVVDDDGPGVPEGERVRVFDRFTRLEPATDGGGLGLALVAALVRGRDGTVTMAAAPEGGARVEVRWRTCQPDSA